MRSKNRYIPWLWVGIIEWDILFYHQIQYIFLAICRRRGILPDMLAFDDMLNDPKRARGL